jgi:hypothetical protein
MSAPNSLFLPLQLTVLIDEGRTPAEEMCGSAPSEIVHQYPGQPASGTVQVLTRVAGHAWQFSADAFYVYLSHPSCVMGSTGGVGTLRPPRPNPPLFFSMFRAGALELPSELRRCGCVRGLDAWRLEKKVEMSFRLELVSFLVILADPHRRTRRQSLFSSCVCPFRPQNAGVNDVKELNGGTG